MSRSTKSSAKYLKADRAAVCLHDMQGLKKGQRVVAVERIQGTLWNVRKPTGKKLYEVASASLAVSL